MHIGSSDAPKGQGEGGRLQANERGGLRRSHLSLGLLTFRTGGHKFLLLTCPAHAVLPRGPEDMHTPQDRLSGVMSRKYDMWLAEFLNANMWLEVPECQLRTGWNGKEDHVRGLVDTLVFWTKPLASQFLASDSLQMSEKCLMASECHREPRLGRKRVCVCAACMNHPLCFNRGKVILTSVLREHQIQLE